MFSRSDAEQTLQQTDEHDQEAPYGDDDDAEDSFDLGAIDDVACSIHCMLGSMFGGGSRKVPESADSTQNVIPDDASDNSVDDELSDDSSYDTDPNRSAVSNDANQTQYSSVSCSKDDSLDTSGTYSIDTSDGSSGSSGGSSSSDCSTDLETSAVSTTGDESPTTTKNDQHDRDQKINFPVNVTSIENGFANFGRKLEEAIDKSPIGVKLPDKQEHLAEKKAKAKNAPSLELATRTDEDDSVRSAVQSDNARIGIDKAEDPAPEGAEVVEPVSEGRGRGVEETKETLTDVAAAMDGVDETEVKVPLQEVSVKDIISSLAAVRNQRAWLRFAKKRAAISIQCLYRQRKARMLLEHLKMLAAISVAAPSKAKTFLEQLKIQSQSAVPERHRLQALVCIQRHARGYLTRRVMCILMEWRKFNRAAIVIQRLFRVVSAHTNAVKLLEQAMVSRDDKLDRDVALVSSRCSEQKCGVKIPSSAVAVEDAEEREEEAALALATAEADKLKTIERTEGLEDKSLDVGSYVAQSVLGFTSALTCTFADSLAESELPTTQPNTLIQSWQEATDNTVREVLKEWGGSHEDDIQAASQNIKAIEAVAVVKIQRACLRFAKRRKFKPIFSKQNRAAIAIQCLYRIMQSRRAAEDRRQEVARSRMAAARSIMRTAARQKKAKTSQVRQKMERNQNRAAISIQGLYRIVQSKRAAELNCKDTTFWSTVANDDIEAEEEQIVVAPFVVKLDVQPAAEEEGTIELVADSPGQTVKGTKHSHDASGTSEGDCSTDFDSSAVLTELDPNRGARISIVNVTVKANNTDPEEKGIIELMTESPGQTVEEIKKESLGPLFDTATATKDSEMKASLQEVLDSYVTPSARSFTAALTESLAETGQAVEETKESLGPAVAAAVAAKESELKASLQEVSDVGSYVAQSVHGFTTVLTESLAESGQAVEDTKESLGPAVTAAVAAKESEMKASIQGVLDSYVAPSVQGFTTVLTESLAESELRAMQSMELMRSWEETVTGETVTGESTGGEEKQISERKRESRVEAVTISALTDSLMESEVKLKEIRASATTIGTEKVKEDEEIIGPAADTLASGAGTSEVDMDGTLAKATAVVRKAEAEEPGKTLNATGMEKDDTTSDNCDNCWLAQHKAKQTANLRASARRLAIQRRRATTLNKPGNSNKENMTNTPTTECARLLAQRRRRIVARRLRESGDDKSMLMLKLATENKDDDVSNAIIMKHRVDGSSRS